MAKYTEWRKKSKRFAYTVSLLPRAEDALDALARAAYGAGERAGLKTGEDLAKRAIELSELMRFCA